MNSKAISTKEMSNCKGHWVRCYFEDVGARDGVCLEVIEEELIVVFHEDGLSDNITFENVLAIGPSIEIPRF